MLNIKRISLAGVHAS